MIITGMLLSNEERSFMKTGLWIKYYTSGTLRRGQIIHPLLPKRKRPTH